MRYLGPILDSGVNPRCPWVEGASLYQYGPSIMMWPAPYNSQTFEVEVGPRVKRMLGFGKGHFRSRSGTPLMDTFPMMFSDDIAIPWTTYSGSRQWIPGSKGVILLSNYGNETAGTAGSDPLYVTHWKNTLRSVLALFGSEVVISVESATRTGAWAKQVTGNEWFWRGDDYVSSTVGATCDFPGVTGDSAWVLLAASSPSYATGQVQIQCNGVTLKTVTTSGTMATFTSAHTGSPVRNYAPCAYKVTGLNAAAGTSGAKTVRVRVNSAASVFVSAVFVPSVSPPHVFYGLDYTRGPQATGYANSIAWTPVFRAAALEVIPEFSYAHVVDLDRGFDNTTMIAALDVNFHAHPNDYGMQHMAARFCEAIIDEIRGPVNGIQVP